MNWHNAYLTTIFVCWPSFLVAQNTAPISFGQEVHKQIASGEVHRYRLKLGQEPTQIVVQASYFDVAVSIRYDNGDKLTKLNSPPLHFSDDYLIITAPTVGNYIIEIAGVSDIFASGDYTLLVTLADKSELRLNAARQTTAAAKVDIAKPSVDRRAALKTALGLYQQSVIAWQHAGDSEQLRRSLTYHGWLALELGMTEMAQSSFTQALALEQGNDIRQAWIYAYLASTQLDQDQLALAEQSYRQALALARQNQDGRGAASFLNSLGLVYQYKNSPATASDWYLKALAELEHVDYPHQRAITLGNIGGTYYQMGDFKKALEYYQDALSAHQQSKDVDQQATVLGNMASLYRDQGDLDQSLDANLQSLSLYSSLGDLQGVDQVYYRLGILFQRMGDFRRSETYYLRAYEGRKKAGIPRRAANSLRKLGSLYSQQGNIKKALETQTKALALYQKINRRIDVARTQVDLAASSIKLQQLESAKGFLDKALPVLRDAKLMPDLADGLMQLGYHSALDGKPDAAKNNFGEALKIQQAVTDPIGEIDAYVALAKLANDSAESLRQLGHAESIARRIHQGVANPALKARFSATLQDLYDSIINTHLVLHQAEPAGGHAKSAFLASERNRARSLLELVSSSSVVESAEQSRLLQQQKALRRRLNSLWSSTNKLRLRSSSHNTEVVQLVASNDAAITDVMTQLDNVTTKLGNARALPVSSEIINSDDIQSALAADELLLHMHLGESQSAIWRISKAQVEVTVLPGQEALQKVARAAYDSLRQINFVDSDRDKLAELASLLIQDQTGLANKRHVYIVADGFLQYIPFSALIDADNKHLLESTAFISLPSSRLLLRNSTTPQFNAETSVLVYADPVFGETDFRAQLKTNDVVAGNDLSRAVTRLGFERINRLPFSSIEAQEIVSSISSAKVISGFAANKQDVLGRNLKDTDVLHFATHGIVNDQLPELSGLILSLIDSEKKPKDGFLSISEIATLPVSAKLVVLSACETGIGEALPGEGLLSLARAFLSQGAENVVSSLWQVNDRATAELMGHFYQALFKQQMPIDQALRYAQGMIANQPQWSAPYYWAGFIASSTIPAHLKPE